MNNKLLALAFVGLSTAAIAPAFAGPNVGVSIGINQPGVYGRVDIGSYPQPALVYPEPVVIVPSPVAVQRQPIYLYVPIEQQRRWRYYCGRYSACGQPVYFVQERWVRDRYEQEHRDWRHDRDQRMHRQEVEVRHDNGRHLGHGPRDDRGDHGGGRGDHGDRGDRGDHGDRGDRGDRGEGHRR